MVKESLETKQKILMNALFLIKVNVLMSDAQTSALKLNSEKTIKEINKKYEELNEFNKNLQKIYQKWEDLKINITDFQHFEGLLKNAICNNSQNDDINICVLNDKTIKN
ncbi:hypothetical protein [Mycoplasma parvum]|uniref:Uncharacterized protein n=1 Tax=Mycoplasma parvum str. Indiana TaxID=1403316 RepID=U5NF99_9MOLU|nr:hypothetical protein [Mycoplasma parvum]AGX88878.1 hypothetical protein PRV_00545 [Mycoplasma parvum str. Indiana]